MCFGPTASGPSPTAILAYYCLNALLTLPLLYLSCRLIARSGSNLTMAVGIVWYILFFLLRVSFPTLH